MQGVVSFWRESRTNHIGRLACLTDPRAPPVPPSQAPFSPLSTGILNGAEGRWEGKSETLASQN